MKLGDGTHILEIHRNGIQALGVGTPSIQLVAVAEVAVLHVHIGTFRHQLSELLGVLLLEFPIRVLQF